MKDGVGYDDKYGGRMIKNGWKCTKRYGRNRGAVKCSIRNCCKERRLY